MVHASLSSWRYVPSDSMACMITNMDRTTNAAWTKLATPTRTPSQVFVNGSRVNTLYGVEPTSSGCSLPSATRQQRPVIRERKASARATACTSHTTQKNQSLKWMSNIRGSDAQKTRTMNPKTAPKAAATRPASTTKAPVAVSEKQL